MLYFAQTVSLKNMNTHHALHAVWHWLGAYWRILLSAVAFASFFEWLLHKEVMHKMVKFGGIVFDYAFRAHAVTHHGTFRSDKSYHLQRAEDADTIRMAWWNWLVLVPVASIPGFIISESLHDWRIAAIFFAVSFAYYVAYESLHWCMHLPLPAQRIIEKTIVFKFLNGHHLLHHEFPRKNFNVVLPLADLCMGTLLLRSPKRFDQPIHPSVPNVQPLGTDER